MTCRLFGTLALYLLVIACSPPAGPPLIVSNLAVFEPLPGTNMTAAYLTLANNSYQPITVEFHYVTNGLLFVATTVSSRDNLPE